MKFKKPKRQPSCIFGVIKEVDTLIAKKGELARVTHQYKKAQTDMKNIRNRVDTLKTWMNRLEVEIFNEERKRKQEDG